MNRLSPVTARLARAAIALAAVVWAGVWALRFPEPLGLDQSLFAFYGTWLGRGLALYRDLWDSKPPGLFVLYAGAVRVAGVAHSAWFLDAVATLAAALLAWRWVRAQSPSAAVAAAVFAGFATSAPLFQGPALAGQAESLCAPLLLAAALCARGREMRSAFACGLLVGVAALLKWSALVWLPMAWVLAAADGRFAARRTLAVVAGVAAPVLLAAAVLASAGVLREAVTATLVYPRAYAAEIASRMPIGPALARGAAECVRGAPLAVVWIAWAAVRAPRAMTIPLGIWLVLAAAGAATQRQMAPYQLFALATPCALLAALGAADWAQALRRSTRPAGLRFVALALVVALPVAWEARMWQRHYAPHTAHAAGRLDDTQFLRALGGSGPRWIEARAIASAIRADSPSASDALFVWGLAPSIYALADRPPATRWAFHQTFYVDGSPLSRRFPDAAARRAELLAQFDRDPPAWVVVVHGDRSGLEPQDSAAELAAFPELAHRLASRYRQAQRTPSYALLRRVD